MLNLARGRGPLHESLNTMGMVHMEDTISICCCMHYVFVLNRRLSDNSLYIVLASSLPSSPLISDCSTAMITHPRVRASKWPHQLVVSALDIDTRMVIHIHQHQV